MRCTQTGIDVQLYHEAGILGFLILVWTPGLVWTLELHVIKLCECQHFLLERDEVLHSGERSQFYLSGLLLRYA